MNKSIIFFVLILLLGFLLRSHNLYTWPRLGATFDEYAWTWQGISLINDKVPTSWSYHPQYKNKKEIIYQKAAFILVTPYLEHPPLFGLAAGSYAILNGARDIYDVDLLKIRGLALLLGMISIVLVFLLSRELYGSHVGLISALLYAIVPTVVVGSRIVQNENFFIPMWLLSIYLAILYLKKKNKTLRNIAIVIASILILAKIPWIAAPFSLAIIFLYKKLFRDFFIVIIATFLFMLAYFIYGFYYDYEVFLGLWGIQLNRYDISFSSIFALFQKPYLADRFYLDGWIFWGWISFIIIAIKDFKKHFILISLLISYFLVFVTGIPDEPGHGWYRYPFYPFLIISIGFFIKEYFAKNWILTFMFLVFIGTTLLELVWAYKFGFSYLVFRTAIVSWGLALVPLYLDYKKIRTTSKIVSYLWLLVFISMSIIAVIAYNEM